MIAYGVMVLEACSPESVIDLAPSPAGDLSTAYLMPICRQSLGGASASTARAHVGGLGTAARSRCPRSSAPRSRRRRGCLRPLVCGGQSIHPNVHVGQQDFQARRDAGESEARRDVCGGSRLFLFPDPLGLHNRATAPLTAEGERAAHGQAVPPASLVPTWRVLSGQLH